MFVFSCKTTKKQLVWAVVCVFLLVAILLTLAFWPEAATDTAAPLSVATAEEGAAYLRSLGYEVSGGDVREIQLPDEPDQTLSTYNALLQKAGLDITPYLGKRVKYRTYTVENHPDGTATAHLYIYKDTIIAGDITVNGVPTILKPKDQTNGTAG